jgi:hypothetical protein
MVGILSSRCRQAGILLLGLVLVGCGSNPNDKLGNVQGKVTVDGAPANSGNVVFTTSGSTLSGVIGPDGTYRVIGVTPGAAQVSVTGPTAPVGSGGANPGAPTPAIKDMAGGAAIGKPVPIPAKYAKPASSGLSFTVKSGQNTFDIPLVSK